MIGPVLDTKQWKKFQKDWDHFQLSRSARIQKALSACGTLIVGRAKSYYLTGQALNVQTGLLRASVHKQPTTGTFKSGFINKEYFILLGTKVWYGKLWEEGKFTVKGGGRSMLPRKWLMPSIVDKKSSCIKILKKAGVIYK